MANKPSTPRGRRSQAEAERTRDRILDHSERLFAVNGFHGVTTRQLAVASGVHPFTIQHHFGSKGGLYATVLARWDDEARARLIGVLEGKASLQDAAEAVIDELFDFLLDRRDWVRIQARVALGEPLPSGVEIANPSWTDFASSALQDFRLGEIKLDLGLLMITVEGMLNHHVLSEAQYRQMYGVDVTDPKLRLRTKEHLKSVFVALLKAHQ